MPVSFCILVDNFLIFFGDYLFTPPTFERKMLFFKKKRDIAFFKACEKIRDTEQGLSVSDIASKAIYTECCSLFLTEQEIAKIIRFIKTHGKKTEGSEAKKEMHEEIGKRYKKITDTHGKITALSAARIICQQKAPRFYITETRAICLYYRLLAPENRIELSKELNNYIG